MNIMIAEELMQSLGKMPAQERVKFFALVGQQAFRDENVSHEEVFGHLADDDFTVAEAAEYLEVSMATFRRFVRDGKLAAHAEVGRNQLFAVADLKAFKRQRKAVKG
ncbi:DNA-binding protein (plasmid) [Cupriavidus sp. USMAHM13]|uniref:helix-turn-helix domain-containing protein n=1 Tax=Cupriavidus sp. USMAHM13 TaxID=1389192 RepID=UPI0008A6751F|nr:helix-turn-helix domain-containing protein [Cupriavidus sp. USMAHM13]AOZ04334.1 DNA-binding protein [Cupriavidus sp. USMAHM13]